MLSIVGSVRHHTYATNTTKVDLLVKSPIFTFDLIDPFNSRYTRLRYTRNQFFLHHLFVIVHKIAEETYTLELYSARVDHRKPAGKHF